MTNTDHTMELNSLSALFYHCIGVNNHKFSLKIAKRISSAIFLVNAVLTQVFIINSEKEPNIDEFRSDSVSSSNLDSSLKSSLNSSLNSAQVTYREYLPISVFRDTIFALFSILYFYSDHKFKPAFHQKYKPSPFHPNFWIIFYLSFLTQLYFICYKFFYITDSMIYQHKTFFFWMLSSAAISTLNLYNKCPTYKLNYDDENDEEDDEEGSDQPKQLKTSRLKIILQILSYGKSCFVPYLLLTVTQIFSDWFEFHSELVEGSLFSDVARKINDFDTYLPKIYKLAVFKIAASLAEYANDWVDGGSATKQMNLGLEKQVFEHIMSFEIGFFDNKSSAKVIEMMNKSSGITKLLDEIKKTVTSLISCITQVTILLGTNWRLTLFAYAIQPFPYILGEFLDYFSEKFQVLKRNHRQRDRQDKQDAVLNVRTMRSFNALNCQTKRIFDAKDDLEKFNRKYNRITNARWTLDDLVKSLAVPLSIIYAMSEFGFEIDRDFITFLFLIRDIKYPFNALFRHLSYFNETLVDNEGLFELLERINKLKQNSGEFSAGDLEKATEGDIVFENVDFGYEKSEKSENENSEHPDTQNEDSKNPDSETQAPKNQLVLNNFNLTIPSGKVTALVGVSGCGKSTCVDLLQNFYQPQSGKLTIGNIPIHEFNIFGEHSIYGNKITTVSQEPNLFPRTISQNITLGDDKFTISDVKRACKLANATEFIEKLPKKYDSFVGENGVKLSGGQKQRIAIARALIRNPKILLLDEATSALDNDSEIRVQRAIDNTLKDRTVLVIAHRLSTIKNADKIAVVDKGRVVEEGNHKKLMLIGGIYEKLVNKQLAFQKSLSIESCGSNVDFSLPKAVL